MTIVINPNIQETMENQYYQPGEDVESVVRRVANYVAGAEAKFGATEEAVKAIANEYFETIWSRLWIPSSPFLMNAGTCCNSLSACFVLKIDDNMDSIFETLYHAAKVHKFGGGTGFNFSSLRPEGAPIQSTGGGSSGVLSFMDLYNMEGEVVKQGGRRRSANIGVLDISHPEILKFIDYKTQKGRLNNFNISVGITDEFMEAVKSDSNWDLTYEGKVFNTIKARELFTKIIASNWASAEPGIIFLDNLNRDNRLLHLGEIRATNPCGEIPLLPGEACNLASINLDEFVDWTGVVNWELLDDISRTVLRFLDNAIEVNEYPFEFIRKSVERTRKAGLGVMGLHGALIKMGLRYDSPEGRKAAATFMKFIGDCALEESIKLSKDRGVPEGWYGSQWETEGVKLRNLTMLTIAPTGTISMILNSSSSGCEPIFAISYERDTRGQTYKWVNPLFKEIGELEGWYSEELVDKITKNRGRVTGVQEVPEKWRNLFITASEISAQDHVLMQAALQEHVDNSISKSVNMPNEATIEDVMDVYMTAWSSGCKGTTIYREGSREGVLRVASEDSSPIDFDDPSWRPRWLLGATTSIQSGCGKVWLTINPYKGRLVEVFASSGAKGGCTSNIQSIGRLVSQLGKSGVDPHKIIDQLKSVTCSSAVANPKSKVRSCSDAVAVAIKDFIDKFGLEGMRFEYKEAKEPNSIEPTEISEDDFVTAINKAQGCRSGRCS